MMKIAIHHREDGFSSSWINYCKEHGIGYKLVNCYDTDIVDQLADCDALMWHFHQANCRDILFAKQLLYSLQTTGKVVFPDFHTAWHFDDKVGQMYLLESVGAPVVPSYIFYDKEQALEWVNKTDFPKVFKLRTGSGSSQVRLIKERSAAVKVVKQAFGKGFSQYAATSNFRERWRKYRKGDSGLFDLVKGLIRFGYTTDFDRVAGKEKGYVYFQDFIEGNDFDIRVIVIDDKAFAIKRIVRENDFRASGSGYIEYEKKNFKTETVKLSFEIAKKLKSQSLAIDYVFRDGQPMIVEISYGYIKEAYERCTGYWDKELRWYEGKFNPQGWMVESVLKKIQRRTEKVIRK